MTWLLQVAADAAPAWLLAGGSRTAMTPIVHFAHPLTAPDCTVPGHYMGSLIALAHPTIFPVEVAQVVAGEAPRWRTVCAPRRVVVPGWILGAHPAIYEPPGFEAGLVPCLACRRWAHTIRRHYHRRSRRTETPMQPCPNCRQQVSKPDAHLSRSSGYTCVRPVPASPAPAGKTWPPKTEHK